MKSFILLRAFVAICILGSVKPNPANSEAKSSDIKNGNEPVVTKHFDFGDFLGNMFGGGGRPGGQSFFPNMQLGNGQGQMNGRQQQYPNQQYPNQGQQTNQNQWQNQPSGNDFGYPNQNQNNGGFTNNNNNQFPWQNTGMQQYPDNNGGQYNNQMPNQGQGQNPSSATPNTLDWKNLQPGLTLNQPPSQNNNYPQSQNPQFNAQWPNQGENTGSDQFQNPRQSIQNPSNGPNQWQNSAQGPINGGQNQNPNVNIPEVGTIDALAPGQGMSGGNIPPSEASTSTTTTTTTTPALCQQSCSSTTEYNPICGDNNVTYKNPGSLLCARNCGLSVRMKHRGRCSGDPANRFMG